MLRSYSRLNIHSIFIQRVCSDVWANVSSLKVICIVCNKREHVIHCI